MDRSGNKFQTVEQAVKLDVHRHVWFDKTLAASNKLSPPFPNTNLKIQADASRYINSFHFSKLYAFKNCH